jgi:hypothetical protein
MAGLQKSISPETSYVGTAFIPHAKKKVLIQHSSLLFVFILDMNDKNNRDNAEGTDV